MFSFIKHKDMEQVGEMASSVNYKSRCRSVDVGVNDARARFKWKTQECYWVKENNSITNRI